MCIGSSAACVVVDILFNVGATANGSTCCSVLGITSVHCRSFRTFVFTVLPPAEELEPGEGLGAASLLLFLHKDWGGHRGRGWREGGGQ